MSDAKKMLSEIRGRYGFYSPEVFGAMLQIPRHKFVDKKYKPIAYDDRPLDIGFGQTMSQPYTVAFMTHLLLADKGEKISEKTKNWRVLEIGTGSGYQAAVLSKLVREVYTAEIIDELARKACARLKDFKNVYVRQGGLGWRQKAPFDAIMVTAGIQGEVPGELFDQLKAGGVLVVPIGRGYDKQMTKFKKNKNGKIKSRQFGTFHFVPFVREGER